MITKDLTYTVLHHPPLTERKEYFTERLQAVGITDYTVMEEYNFDKAVSLPVKSSLNKASVSLILKHKKVLTQFSNNFSTYSDVLCVLEDDCTINDNFKEIVTKCSKELNEFSNVYQWGDIAFIGTCACLHTFKTNPDKLLQYAPNLTTRCTHCYIVTKKGAQTIMESRLFDDYDKPIDHKLNDIILEKKLVCLWYEPGIKQNPKFPSSVI